MTISAKVERLLLELTGEVRPEVALQQTIRDVLDHRLEAVDKEIMEFEQKYKTTFDLFQKAWQEGKLMDRFSFPVEKDFWEWEALISRRQKLQQLGQWVP